MPKPIFDEKVVNKDTFWPKISIVTPSYNQGKFLAMTIRSVSEQSYNNIEHIIIDGGSTDNSLEIIKEHEKLISYWVSEKDEGMYDAINKGLKIASGDIVAYLNSDDLYLSDTIKTVVDHFQKNQEAFLVYGDTNYIDAEGNYICTYRYPAFKFSRYIRLNWSSIPQQACFWRREVHEKIGYFNAKFKMAGDFDFFARAGQHHKIDHLKKVLAAQRIHAETLSYTQSDINKEEVKRIHQYFAVSSGFITTCQRIVIDMHIKFLNLPLMIKKLLRLLALHSKL